MTMAETIRMLRTRRGITQEELGNLLGVQKSAIRKYESGMVENIPRSSIKKMAEYFGVTPSYLMGWVEEESPRDTTITEGEKAILEAYRSLPEAARDKLTQLLERFRALDQSEQEHYLDVLRVMLRRTP